MKYNPKPGQTAKIVTNGIKKKLEKMQEKGEKANQRKKQIKNSKRMNQLKYGKFKNKELKYIINGLDFISEISQISITQLIEGLNRGNIQVQDAKTTAYIIYILDVIGYLSRATSSRVYEKYSKEREKAYRKVLAEYREKTRDGRITKEKVREENGKNMIYQESISEREVDNVFKDYVKTLARMEDDEFLSYVRLGLNVLSLIGSIKSLSSEKEEKTCGITLGIGTLIDAGTLIGKKYINRKEIEGIMQKEYEIRNLKEGLIHNEPISYEEEMQIEKEITELIEEKYKKEVSANDKIRIIGGVRAITMALINSINISAQIGSKGKMDNKDISQMIVNLKNNNVIMGKITKSINDIENRQKDKQRLEEREIQLLEIDQKIAEKQDILCEVDKPFEKISIDNFYGKFYPVIEQETGEKHYQVKIQIPEFSAEKGQMILLTGESGIGKTTFIKLLKRGDAENRGVITIDDNEKVDKLGRQFMAFRPDRRLGITSNVLKQLTGKENFDELTEKEKKQVIMVLENVGLNDPQIIKQLETKNNSQFSTGEQMRLAFAELICKKKAPILLADEPVGNVEKELREEQFKVLSECTKKSGIITILITHEVDIAQKYADKHYHFGSDRKLVQVEQEVEKER